MMDSKGRKSSIFTLLSFALISICAAVCFGEVLFEDDFEKNAIDEDKWVLEVGWKIVQGQGIKGNALNVNKGAPGLAVKNDFTDFEFSCDFHPVGPALYAPAFCLRAQDPENLYMPEVVADERDAIWWHIRDKGKWIIPEEAQLPNESGVKCKNGEWYSIKIVAQGKHFELHLAESGKELKLSSTWEDGTFSKGAIGFYGGSQECLYDNVLVTTIGGEAVKDLHKNLPTVWGGIRNGY